ncbi:MAG TPA: hypothetical protein VHT96_05700 [Clostridia bacterium]|nr:hypothetical protein [Clostridia bacterium]
MNKNTEVITTAAKKSKSAGKKAGIAILIILLLPVVLAGLLLLYLNIADFTYDNPQELIKSAPMSFSERNSFDPGSSTRTMRIDKADTYFLLKDKIPDLHFSDSIYIKSYRIALDESAIYLQGKAYGINIPLKVNLEVGSEGGNILVNIKSACLGKLNIPLPLKYISEKAGLGLEYTFPVMDIPELKTAESISLKDGYINLTFPVNRNIINEGIPAWPYLKPAAFYLQEQDPMIGLIEDFDKNWTVDGYKSEKLGAFMETLNKDPDKYQELKIRMLAVAPEEKVEEFFASEDHNPEIMARFYPGITKQAVEQMRNKLNFSRNYKFIMKYAFEMDAKFGEKAIIVKNGDFIDTRTGKRLDLYKVYKDSPEMKEVFPEGSNVRAIFCEGTDSRQKINRIWYGCGTAVQFPNGRCAVICKSERKLYFMEIKPEEFSDLVSGKENVYIVAFKG